MYSRAKSRKTISLCTCITLLLLASTAATSSVADEGVDQVTVPPGGYSWSVFSEAEGFSDFQTVNTIATGPLTACYRMLPESALQAIELSAEWLRGDLALRFTDLLYKDVYSELPVVPAFADVNGDGQEDLILQSQSALRAFIAPNWIEFTEIGDSFEPRQNFDVDNNGTSDSSYFTADGVLTLMSGDSILLVTEGFDVPSVTGTALGDMEGDGLADLVVTTEAGNVLVFRNRGTVEVPCFLPFFQESRKMFPMNPGAFSSPVLFSQNDSVVVCVVGTQQEGLSFYISAATDGSPVPEWSLSNTVLSDNDGLNISPVIVNFNGETALLCGSRDGTLYEADIDSDSLIVLGIPAVPGTYPNLTTAEVNGDDFFDLVAGTMEGGVYYLAGDEERFHGDWIKVNGIPLIPSGAPARWEDGLVFGSADGTLRYFSQNRDGEWIESTENSEFSSIDVGEYSTPVFFDVDNDGIEELTTGNSGGTLTIFELGGEDSRFRESFSWEFQPNAGVSSIESCYSRYFKPYSVFRSPSGVSSVNAFADEIINAEARYRDEIAYSIANTATDILRAIEGNSDIDLFTVNAACIYSASDSLRYVRLVDWEEGTTCLLKTDEGWFEISRENYYRFVVHPRILFEVPGRIDATYWNTPRDTLAISERDYLNFEPESLYGHSSNHHFWREFIPADTSRGRSLEERMMGAETYEEAVLRLCNFQSHSQPNGLMSFGYITNDLHPLAIYSKAYGSCGEQSILQTALCRALFIPSYVVGCRGEDHQWNQYLDPESGKWNHWDINYGISGIRNLWVSGEGTDHLGKTISTISAFGPEGQVWSVTESVLAPPGSGYMEGDSGYTHTAQVDITVTDPDGMSVDGAMVMARSHWENANSVTAFDYTDESGDCTFLLGWEPNGGYTFDIVSAYGSAGSSNISFTEDRHYQVSYTVPYRIPQRQEVFLPVSASPSPPSVSVVNKLYTVPYFTGSLYSVGSETEEVLKNPDWIPWKESASSGELLFMDGRNFRSYRNGFNCSAVRGPFIPQAGDSCFAVLDNRNSMFIWREYTIPLPEDFEAGSVPDWLDSQSRTPVAGSCIPGIGTSLEQRGALWIKSYLNLEIFQDDPDDPLSSALIIGPFRAPSGQRSLSIGTGSDQADLDLDLFLFADQNGNRTVDGMSELVTSSASPTSSEIVFISEPDTSTVYWIYIHGWQVDEDGGSVDLGLSFEPEMLRVHSLSPTGFRKILPQQFSFLTEMDTLALETGDICLQSGDGETVIFPESAEDRWYFETLLPGEFFTDGFVQIFLSNGELVEGIDWSFSLDTLPPVISFYSADVDYSTMQAVIEVGCTDMVSGIERVTLVLDSTVSTELVLREDSVWSATVDFLPFSDETVFAEVCAVDFAGNESTKNYETSTLSRPEVVFSYVYPSGSVFDHTPNLQLFAGFENQASDWTAAAILSGAGFREELVPAVIDGNIIQFSVRELLADGEYMAQVQILGADGVVIGEHQWSFSIETMSSTTGIGNQ